ncbi:MAG: hypothetical protein CMJ80_15260 [Planctomycetaceae bacterium]|nr:hypothetical protein [Planctomycetaceae bacterium]
MTPGVVRGVNFTSHYQVRYRVWQIKLPKNWLHLLMESMQISESVSKRDFQNCDEYVDLPIPSLDAPITAAPSNCDPRLPVEEANS